MLKQAHLDFVRCSTCFCRPSTTRPLCITSCGHFTCISCFKSSQNGPICLVCKKPCSFIELRDGSKLMKKVQGYFCNPVVELKKIARSLEFQQFHAELGTKPLAATQADPEYEHAKQMHEALAANYKELDLAFKLLRQKAESLGITTCHPTPTSDTPGSKRASTILQETPQGSVHSSQSIKSFRSSQLVPVRCTPVMASQQPLSMVAQKPTSTAATSQAFRVNTPNTIGKLQSIQMQTPATQSFQMNTPSVVGIPQSAHRQRMPSKPLPTSMQDSVESMIVSPAPRKTMSQQRSARIERSIPTFGQQCNPFVTK